ncbi:MAG: Asp-tRNA(Asn)/Glu-tRNA(Gln) amidotransferase subunit GatB [Solirubrobacterales bacterium]
MAEWESVIGLEIHVQLRTKTKMFCGCELSFGDATNTHTCPVCLGHPGTLPVVNEQAIVYGLQIAAALGCEVAPRSTFHRKNYFYPDLPKGYQISQYDVPLASGGTLGGVRIHRAHLEEDAAKLIHVGESGRIHGSGASLVDFNRGGTPLVEIVTEPDLRDAASARQWAHLLRTTLRQLGVSDVNMEEGSLRVDANVSIRRPGDSELGTKAELKNMNSFRFLEHGIDAEIARQIEIVEGGGGVDQETLHYDPRSGSLTALRSKEYAHDYRYFPEPDLVPLAPTEEMLSVAAESLPELPEARRERYRDELGLPDDTASQLANDAEAADYFERVRGHAASAEAKAVANWVTGDLAAAMREAELDQRPSEEALAKLIGMVASKQISHGAGRQVLATLLAEGGNPEQIAEAAGLAGGAEKGELEAAVARAIEAQPEAAERVREGNMKAIGPLVGAVMKETRGAADGEEVTRLIRSALGL